jgi:hypothetical protein
MPVPFVCGIWAETAVDVAEIAEEMSVWCAWFDDDKIAESATFSLIAVEKWLPQECRGSSDAARVAAAGWGTSARLSRQRHLRFVRRGDHPLWHCLELRSITRGRKGNEHGDTFLDRNCGRTDDYGYDPDSRQHGYDGQHAEADRAASSSTKFKLTQPI